MSKHSRKKLWDTNRKSSNSPDAAAEIATVIGQNWTSRQVDLYPLLLQSYTNPSPLNIGRKSNNLLYNMLGRWVAGTIVWATKRLITSKAFWVKIHFKWTWNLRIIRLLYFLICQKLAHFWSTQMAILSSFFWVFIVLGM